MSPAGVVPGRPFLQIPGPTNLPERVLAAMHRPIPDHHGPQLPGLMRECVDGLRRLFGTTGPVVLFAGSGSAALESTVANLVAPGEVVLCFDNGVFGHHYAEIARALGVEVDEVPVEWGRAVPATVVAERLAADRDRRYRAVLVVHNETSTGAITDLQAVRAAIDDQGHPALLLVDGVSSVGSVEFRMDAWGVDAAACGSQKGLMLPPGLGLVAIGQRALARARTPRGWTADWARLVEAQGGGRHPNTPPTLLLYGLRAALRLLFDEGLDRVWARHRRLAEAIRRAVAAWGLEIVCRNAEERSDTVTAVRLPPGVTDQDVLRAAAGLNLWLGAGLGKLAGSSFRIGHLGWLNELEVIGALAGCELALAAAGVGLEPGSGLSAAQAFLFQELGTRPVPAG